MAADKKTAHFKKTCRLLNAQDYKNVFDHNQYRASSSQLLVLVYQPKNHRVRPARLGIVVGKKNIPKAVDRNSIKRVVRESFRLLLPAELSGMDLVVVSRKGLSRHNKPQIQKELLRLLDSIKMKLARREKTSKI